ncbi:MAG: DUF3445 domain-containing protein [Mesorhizobium sp.]
MTTLPLHTPYDGTSKPFTIGLKPIDFDRWIEIDAHYPAYIEEKRRLYAEIPDKVFVAEAGTQAAQQEVADLIAGHLHQHAPTTLCPSSAQSQRAQPTPTPPRSAQHLSPSKGERKGATPDISSPPSNGGEVVCEANRSGGRTPAGSLSGQPLYHASLQVQEDLILMRRGDEGWRLAAGSLCFPSSWSLQEKFRQPLEQIHVPVPGFGPGSRPDQLIARMFDALSPDQLMERYNWSIQAGDALYLPLSNDARDERAATRPSKFPGRDMAASAFIRIERQTLRKLPLSRDVLFTIRIHLDPLKVIAEHPERARLAASFAEQLTALDAAQLDYKGMTADRDRLVDLLLSMARGG